MNTKPVMLVRGVRYVEKATVEPDDLNGYCKQCAFFHDMEGCGLAVFDDVAVKAFGGDCIERDVVYAKEAA